MDREWLNAARADRSLDLLQLGMQYIAEADPVYEATGLRIGGDADYGPLLTDGTRQEGSDFNDYLGVAWTYSSGSDLPEATRLGSLDCSGFLRMLWGYRTGLPLVLAPDGIGIPRRAYQILSSAPGVVTIPNRGKQVTDFSRLAPGDIVFFEADTDDGTQIDHAGMYLGRDTVGRHRFVSSRKSINGPTLGDYRGASVVDGTGLYAKAFRAARRFQHPTNPSPFAVSHVTVNSHRR